LIQNKFTVGDDFSWQRGNHNFQGGASLVRVQTNLSAPFNIGGNFFFGTLESFLRGSPFLMFGMAPPSPSFTTNRYFREIDFLPYFQDDWKVTSRLTLNFGARYDYATNAVGIRVPLFAILNPLTSTGFTQVQHVLASNPNLRNIDPRIGLAWDPFGDHKTSIRAGFGIFYNPIRARSYASGYYFNPPYALAFVPNPSFPNPFPGALPPPAQLVGVDYNTDLTPHLYQWNLNIQRQIFESTTLTVGYVGSRGLHLYGARDINPVLPTIVNGVQVFGVPKGTAAVPASGITSNPRLNPA